MSEGEKTENRTAASEAVIRPPRTYWPTRTQKNSSTMESAERQLWTQQMKELSLTGLPKVYLLDCLGLELVLTVIQVNASSLDETFRVMLTKWFQCSAVGWTR